MSNSRLSKRFQLYDWNKFSKEYKKTYKEENGKPLNQNTAFYLTFGQLTKPSLFDADKSSFKEPEVESVVRLIRLGNNNCSEEDACTILENYLDDDSIVGRSLTLAMIDLIIDFYSNLRLSSEMLAKATELKKVYLDSYLKVDAAPSENKDD